ncbi:hypothetical protein SP5_013_00120 [Sphingomonas parapaucimobilis NBRC 15100]|uniref:Uncharacterized protein n=1 Tax=Sphingomonas parapaucimobilis NBRC 15100 TaxID=1219049 RepID=A0A0A1W336_9SPHN|nr:hypothetical protein SP5_013_00120 [Sphingomonas parapaucimobilis NBRC 15100]
MSNTIGSGISGPVWAAAGTPKSIRAIVEKARRPVMNIVKLPSITQNRGAGGHRRRTDQDAWGSYRRAPAPIAA